MRKLYQVNIIESERGWGQKVDTTFYFSDEVIAKEFIELYNAANDLLNTPDIYWRADWPSVIEIPDEDGIIKDRETMMRLIPAKASLYMDSATYGKKKNI